MENVRDNMINDFLEERLENVKYQFRQQVNGCLNQIIHYQQEIKKLQELLDKEKQNLRELEFVTPEPVVLD